MVRPPLVWIIAFRVDGNPYDLNKERSEWGGRGDFSMKTTNTLSPGELRILQAVAGHARRNPGSSGSRSLPRGMHETMLVKKTGIPLDELMTLRRDEYDRVRRSGLIQTLCAKLLVGLTDGDRKDRFGYVWITPAGLQASHAGPLSKRGTQPWAETRPLRTCANQEHMPAGF